MTTTREFLFEVRREFSTISIGISFLRGDMAGRDQHMETILNIIERSMETVTQLLMARIAAESQQRTDSEVATRCLPWLGSPR